MLVIYGHDFLFFANSNNPDIDNNKLYSCHEVIIEINVVKMCVHNQLNYYENINDLTCHVLHHKVKINYDANKAYKNEFKVYK